LGEEPILSGGLWGSQNALMADPDFFKKFKERLPSIENKWVLS
jgi:hypothetical protein